MYLVEGEKDADRLASLGLPATTEPGGAGKWRPEYNQALKGKRVVIFPDNDAPGRKDALDKARALLDVAAAVKVVELPGLDEKGDVSDWLDSGRSRADLAAITDGTAALTAAGLAELERRWLPAAESQRSTSDSSVAAVAVATDWPEPEPLAGSGDSNPYPLGALPNIIRDAVGEVLAFFQTPDSMAACSAL